MSQKIIDTPLGKFLLLTSGKKIISFRPAKGKLKEKSDKFTESIVRDIELYFKGKKVDFKKYELKMDKFTPFERKVLETLRKLDFGEIITYKELARRAGYPKAFRAVGNVLHKNPWFIIVPCHRIIKSDGSLGGFALGTPIKKWLIEHEKKVLEKA